MPDRTDFPLAGPAEVSPLSAKPPAPGPGLRRSKWLIIGVALLLVAGGLGLLARAAWQLFRPAPLTALEILEQVKAEVIPAEGTATDYGVTFSPAGYDTLVAWKDKVPVEANWAADYEALDITLPCCGVAHPFADETKNCGCGHHQALYGLAKRLLTDGYGRDAAQAAIGRWTAYMYPKEILAAEMQRRALADPAVNQALQELVEKGQC